MKLKTQYKDLMQDIPKEYMQSGLIGFIRGIAGSDKEAIIEIRKAISQYETIRKAEL